MRKYAIDSEGSDSEGDNGYGALKYVGLYVEDMVERGVINIPSLTTIKRVQVALGLILHDFSSAIFRDTDIHTEYKRQKQDKLGLTEEEYNGAITSIKKVFDAHFASDGGLGKKSRDLIDKEYIKLFCYLYNNKVSKPEIVEIYQEQEFKLQVKQDLCREDNSNIGFLLKGYQLSMEYKGAQKGSANSAELLATSLLVNRRNKNISKYYTTIGTDATTTNLMQWMGSFIMETHILHADSQKVQSQIPHLKNYEEEIKLFQEADAEKKKDLVKFISEVVKIGRSEISLTPFEKEKALNFAHLLFVSEMERNKATLVTAPMLLELMHSLALAQFNIQEFPMAMPAAVEASRSIVTRHSSELLDEHSSDLSITTSKLDEKLLAKEGQFLTLWSKEIREDKYEFYKLSGSMGFMEAYERMDKKEAENITAEDIKILMAAFVELEKANPALLSNETKMHIEEIGSKMDRQSDQVSLIDLGCVDIWVSLKGKIEEEDIRKKVEELKVGALSVKNLTELLEELKSSTLSRWYNLKLIDDRAISKTEERKRYRGKTSESPTRASRRKKEESLVVHHMPTQCAMSLVAPPQVIWQAPLYYHLGHLINKAHHEALLHN